KTTDQLHPYFLSIELEQHAVEMAFDDFRLKVGHRFEPVGPFVCKGILQHNRAISIIRVRQRECRTVKIIEEPLLCMDIRIEGFMEIQVIVRDIGKDRAREIQSGDPLLYNGM